MKFETEEAKKTYRIAVKVMLIVMAVFTLPHFLPKPSPEQAKANYDQMLQERYEYEMRQINK